MPAGFFRFRPGLAPVISVRTLMAGAFFGAEAFVPLMIVEQRHLSLLVAGSTLTVGALGWTAGSWLQSRRSLPLRRDQILVLGATSLAIGVAGVTAGDRARLWVGLVALGWVLAGLGMGLATASTAVATMALSGPGEQGRNASSLQFGEAFGAGLFIGVGRVGLRRAAALRRPRRPTFAAVLAHDDGGRRARRAGVPAHRPDPRPDPSGSTDPLVSGSVRIATNAMTAPTATYQKNQLLCPASPSHWITSGAVPPKTATVRLYQAPMPSPRSSVGNSSLMIAGAIEAKIA